MALLKTYPDLACSQLVRELSAHLARENLEGELAHLSGGRRRAAAMRLLGRFLRLYAELAT